MLQTERVLYVDTNGKPTGETEEKLAAHHAHTKLHLAFSCYIFNEKKQLLVTQRALKKKVWPGVWTNSVCGHPGPGESIHDAIIRRAEYELGLNLSDVKLILPNYSYKTPPYNGIIEHEFCPVFVASATVEPIVNNNEVEAYKWMNWDDFVKIAKADSDNVWSWWCKDQIDHLQLSHKFNTYKN